MLQSSSPNQAFTSTSTFENSRQLQGTSSFEAFYDKYAPAFYGEIKRRLYADEVSQSVLEEAFKKIYNSPDVFNSSKEKIFISALKLVRNEISSKKVDIVLDHILYRRQGGAMPA